jgi:hypothetical protein
MISIWPENKYEIVRNSFSKTIGTKFESDGFTTRSSKKYLVKKINYKVNKKKIRIFTHEKIDNIKDM